MNSIIDELQYSPRDRLLSEAVVSHLTTMNLLYRNGLITQNELRIGLREKVLVLWAIGSHPKTVNPIARN